MVCLGLSTGISTLEDIRGFVGEYQGPDTVIAIDAPLIIENESGQRPCETLVSRRFSSAHAGAHTSNATLHPAAGGVQLARHLELLRYRHCAPPDEPWEPAGRWFFEVYPHPAHVVLFERTRIIKYKKGRVRDRKRGLRELQAEIRTRIFGPGTPFVCAGAVRDLLELDPVDLRGRGLKQHEDLLDSVLCAYLAFHLWRWGWDRNEMIGNLGSGYIVVPSEALATAREACES